MDPIEVSSVTVSPGRSAKPNQAGEVTIVWLRGEHDAATAAAMSAALREAVSVDYGDVVIDLSDVQFMGAAIIGEIVHAEGVLRAQSRVLRLRRPTRCALRIVELCALEQLLEDPTEIGRATGPAGALGTWVPVPHTAPVDRPGRGAGSDPKPLPIAPKGSAQTQPSQQHANRVEPMSKLSSTLLRKGP